MPLNYFAETLSALARTENLRSIPADMPSGGIVDLSGNDYLGIAADVELRRRFWREFNGDIFPSFSASASRLLASDQREFSRLESLLAELYGAPVLLFNSGYHANTGAIAALAKGKTLIVADKLVHASIIDGMRLSGADFERFRHNDVAHLQRILSKKSALYERVLIVCESVYSMDGDVAPIEEIAACKPANGLLYVDEAHAFGVMGRDGLGLAQAVAGVDFIVGTLGKAAASVGAFIVCLAPHMREYLLNTARSFIFSTALPPVNCAWSRFVIEQIPSMTQRRERLQRLSARLGRVLGIENPTHIQPFIVGSSAKALAMSAKLLERGFKVLPIRTPTVPPGTERLRFSLSADINEKRLEFLDEAIIYSKE